MGLMDFCFVSSDAAIMFKVTYYGWLTFMLSDK